VSNRIESILRLLRCYFDGDFLFTDVHDSLANLKTQRGPAPSKRVECPDCGQSEQRGMLRRRGFWIPCARCGGSFLGEESIQNVPGRGWIEVDDYTGQQVSTSQAPAKPRTRSVTCDRCGGLGVRARTEQERLDDREKTVEQRYAEEWSSGLPRCEPCEGSGRIDVPINLLPVFGAGRLQEERTGDAVIDAAAIRDRYSFAVLEQVLGAMRMLHPQWHRALLISFGRIHGGYATVKLEAAPHIIDLSLTSDLKVPGYAKQAEERQRKQLSQVRGVRPGENGKSDDRRAIKARNEEIRRLHFVEKLSVHEIRQRFPLSRSLVYAILEERNGSVAA
jgi:hypothetical protein